ncbi:DUF4405 domain-containing protein [Sulfurospirillum diekertiae]
MISKSLFSFLGFKSTLMLRQIHTTSAYWFVIFCFIHLGIHWQRFWVLFRKILARVINLNFILPRQLSAIFSLLVIFYAGWVFIQRDILSKLFMTFAFEFWDNEQAGWKILMDDVILMIALVILTQSVQKWTKALFLFIDTLVYVQKKKP